MIRSSASRSLTQFLSSVLVISLGVSSLKAQTPVRPMLEIDEAIFETYEGGATAAQNALPFAAQRGVGLDGSLRSQAPFGWAVNANPFSHEWNNNARFRDDIMLHTGRYSPTEIDMALPAPGFRWTVGRTYSIPENGGYFEGYQGHNWQQFSQPELVYVEMAESIEDIIYIVYGADRFLEFRELEDGSEVFRGVNGAAGAIVCETIPGGFDEPSHDVFVYWDRNGTRSYFFDAADAANTVTGHDAGGQLWKIVDAAGNTAYVGGQSVQDGVAGYDTNGKMQVAYDTAGRKYDYTYASGKLTKVEAFVDDGMSGWDATGAVVEYTYATTTEANHFNTGNLTEVKVTMPLSGFDPDPMVLAPTISYESYYQYDTFGDDQHWLRHVHNAESVRRFKDVLPSESLFNHNEYDIRPYSEINFANYETSSPNKGALLQAYWPGHNTQSETGGNNVRYQGRVSFAFTDYLTFSNTALSYDSEHASFVTVTGYTSKDKFHQYFDEAGQPLSRVVNPDSEDSIPPMWNFISRDASVASSGDDDAPLITDGVAGMINVHARPMSIETGVVNPSGSNYISPCSIKANTAGKTDGYLVNIFPRLTTATDPYFGFMSSRSWQNGGDPDSTTNGDGPHKITSNVYLDDVNRVELASEYYLYTPLVSQEARYPQLDIGGSGQGTGEVFTHTYKFHAEPLTGSSTAAVDDPQWLVPRQITTGLPAVPTSQLGSGVSETEDVYLRADGTEIYFRNAEDVYSYMQIENGLEIRVIEDADFGESSYQSGEEPSVYMATVPSTTGAMHLITDLTRDEVGRVSQEILPTGRIKQYHHTKLASGELVRVGSSKTVGSTHTGPGSYVAYDHVGNVIVDARFAIEPDSETTPGQTITAMSGWVDDAADIALDSLLVGDFSEVTTHRYEETGRVVYTNRVYHTLPSSGLGERYYNFDEEIFGYGYGWRQEVHFEANGTTRFTSYDPYNKPDLIKVGSYEPRWEPDSAGSSTVVVVPAIDPLPLIIASVAATLKPNTCCVIVIAITENSFTVGCNDSHTGPVLAFGTGEQGVSYHQSDIQERTVFDYNSIAPHTFREYDNLGRMISAATYSAVPDALDLLDDLPDPEERDEPDIFEDFDSRVEGPADVSQYRTGLVEYVYNPRGQLYKIITYEIDQSTGATVGGEPPNTLETIIGYDPVGRTMYSNNGQINKITYDALGRVTDRYTISESDDVLTNYSDLLDTEDDVVIEETHYARNNESGNVTLSVSVDRLPDVPLEPSPLDKLDSTDYSDYTSITILQANMEGRPQIVEYEYDTLDRPLERRVHGTGDIENANFVLASPPSGALVTALEFGPDGRVGTVTDSLLREHKRSYNLAGRTTQVIENYVDSGTGLDENRTTEYVYENTQLTTYRAYEDANAMTPVYQETVYTWGEYDGSVLQTGKTHDHVTQIEYPDGETEYFTYNIHANLEYFKDRAGNEFKIKLDELYRPEMIDYYTVVSDYLPYSDGLHDIEITYEDRGLVSSVAQYRGSTLYDKVDFDYDGWGAIESFTQDHEWLEDQASSAVEKTMQYDWGASHSTGPSTLRLNSMTNPDGSVLTNLFSGATNTALSRVLSMTLDLDGAGTTHSPVTVAKYEYLGLDRVSKTTYPENDVYSTLKDASHNYDALDRFNRVTRSRWNRTRASNQVPFYDTTVHWDAGSNITGVTDHIFDDHFNFEFENDDLDRMEQSTRGGGTGSGIVGVKEQEDWVLSRIGNWDNHDLDLNGDLDWSDADEFKAESAFSTINEQTKIDYDTDNDSLYDDVSVARLYDANGNLISDPDKGHVYKWDALGRLAAVYNDATEPDLIAEFKYNALGYRIAERFDSTADGKVDSSDTIWTRLIYDVRWRVVATYEVDVDVSANTEDLTQRHVHHNAGLHGVGTGSYIDSVVLRDRDTNGDGTLDERHYFCQNFRADVVAIIDDGGFQIEQMRYTPYGVPFSIPFADQEISGSLNFQDVSKFNSRYGGASYDVRVDTNLDGSINFLDFSAFNAQYSALSSGSYGRGVQSAFDHNRGYAGYWYVPELGLSHVRYRWYDADLGAWISKDPEGYVDGANLYSYGPLMPLTGSDPLGLGWLNSGGGHHGNYTSSGVGGRTSPYGNKVTHTDGTSGGHHGNYTSSGAGGRTSMHTGGDAIIDYWTSSGPLPKTATVPFTISGGATGILITGLSGGGAVVPLGSGLVYYFILRSNGWDPTGIEKVDEGLDVWCTGLGGGLVWKNLIPGFPR